MGGREVSQQELSKVRFAVAAWDLDWGVLRVTAFQPSLVSLHQPQPQEGKGRAGPRWAWIQISVPLPADWVMWDRLLHTSVPPFSHPQNGYTN